MTDSDSDSAALAQYLKTANDIALDVPGFKGALEPHQRVAAAFNMAVRQALLLYPVGLGKTIMAIAIALLGRSLGRTRRTLVLCQSGKRWDWLDEFQRFSALRLVLVDGDKAKRVARWTGGQNADVTIASYEQVRHDLMSKETLPGDQAVPYYMPSTLLQVLHYDYVIYDEPTVFKTFQTAINLALQMLMQKCAPYFTSALSATPIQKSVEDIYSIVNVARPGYLGTKVWFDMTFVKREERGGFWRVTGSQNDEGLRRALAPIFIRREKHEVYPGRTVHRFMLRRVMMLASQLRKYDEVVQGSLVEMDRDALMRRFRELEKVVATMAYFKDEDGTAPCDDSAKLDDLRFLLDSELADEKVVVFSKNLLPLAEAERKVLKPLGIEYIRYTGQETDVEQRHAGLARFNEDPKCRIALVSSAAEMGLNMHAAHYIIFLDHIYNPARVYQLIGRIDRPIVQKSSFICSIHLTTVGTFEEDIIPKLHTEADLAKRLLGAENKFDGLRGELIDQLSRENLFNLIRHGKVPNHAA